MLTTKLAGLGLAAKAALGLGVAAAAVTTAGATGVLPPPAQHVVANVVDAVTPLQLPDPIANANVNVSTSTPDVSIPGADDPAGHDATDDNPAAGGTTGTGDDDATAAAQTDNHGACVSAVAHDTSNTGRDHGKAVSAAAKSDCGKEGSPTSTSTSSTTSTSTTTTLAGGNNAATTGNSNRGNGNGNGNGNSGTSGHGNSGKD